MNCGGMNGGVTPEEIPNQRVAGGGCEPQVPPVWAVSSCIV